MDNVEILVTNSHAFTVCICGENLTLNKPIFGQTYYEGKCSKCKSEYKFKDSKLCKLK